MKVDDRVKVDIPEGERHLFVDACYQALNGQTGSISHKHSKTEAEIQTETQFWRSHPRKPMPGPDFTVTFDTPVAPWSPNSLPVIGFNFRSHQLVSVGSIGGN
jgi:hypothetical protein